MSISPSHFSVRKGLQPETSTPLFQRERSHSQESQTVLVLVKDSYSYILAVSQQIFCFTRSFNQSDMGERLLHARFEKDPEYAKLPVLFEDIGIAAFRIRYW